MRAASEELLLDCGDGVTLQAFHSSPAKRGREPGKRLAVLLHGWEGSADSTYLLSLAQTCSRWASKSCASTCAITAPRII